MLVERLLSPWVLQNEAESPESGGDTAAPVETPTEPVQETSTESTSNEFNRDEWAKVINEVSAEREAEAAADKPQRERDASGRFKKKEAETVQEETAPADDIPAEVPAQAEETPDVVRLAQERYGLSEEDAKQFKDADELQRFMAFQDRQTIARLRAQQEQPKGDERIPPAETKQPEAPTAQQVKEAEATADGFEELLKQMEADDVAPSLIAPIRRLSEQSRAQAVQMQQTLAANQALMSKLDTVLKFTEAQEQRHFQQQVQHEQAMFVNIADQLNLPDLFGTSEKGSTPVQQANLRKLLDDTKALQQVLAMQGQNVPLTKQLVERAAHMTFGNQLKTAAELKRSQQVIKQSRRVMGNPQPTKARDDLPFDGDWADSPQVKQWWAKNVTGAESA